MGEATLKFGRGERGPSERSEGGSTKVSNAVLAFAFFLAVLESRAVTNHYTYGGRLDNHLVGALLFCSRVFHVFPELRGRKTG